MTHFYHHTHIEFFFIVKGFRTIRNELKNDILSQAIFVQEKNEKDNIKTEPSRLMCPLNINGKCVIYKHRPMICRMHGIPHELKKPGAPVHYGKGCNLFMENHFNENYFPFDRTPFYFKMARLENEMKREIDLNGKFKKTISEMLADMKSIDIKDIETLPGRKLNDSDTFMFRCHSGLECFNKCCRNLNLFLYPYDIICLKNKLGNNFG